jgi:hypothetical protein
VVQPKDIAMEIFEKLNSTPPMEFVLTSVAGYMLLITVCFLSFLHPFDQAPDTFYPVFLREQRHSRCVSSR